MFQNKLLQIAQALNQHNQYAINEFSNLTKIRSFTEAM